MTFFEIFSLEYTHSMPTWLAVTCVWNSIIISSFLPNLIIETLFDFKSVCREFAITACTFMAIHLMNVTITTSGFLTLLFIINILLCWISINFVLLVVARGRIYKIKFW